MSLKRAIAPIAALAAVVVLAAATSGASAGPKPSLPRGFFGVAPQTLLEPRDISYMRAGGIESIRVPVPWSTIQPTPKSRYQWGAVDRTIELATRQGLQVLPFLAGTPRWLGKSTHLPVDTARQRAAWIAFVQAAVRRYGPNGEFWTEHATEGVDYEPPISSPLPVRTWQVWNEANFFYFAYPVSPQRYAKLLTITSKAIKQVQPSAKVVLTGLFGEPTAHGRKGMPAAQFLRRLYRYPGIKSRFDGVALHPYAVDAASLEEMVEDLHEVTLENHDRPGLYITEMGWGSQNDFQHDAFEQGVRGQVRQLKDAYGYLIENQRRLNLKQVYWFSWKDAPLLCDFCDSVGFFREGAGFHAKPSWHAFVKITGGRARP